MKFDPSVDSNLMHYYYTNYTRCPPSSTSSLATWEFVATFLHSVLVIQSPLAVFTGYCIVKKTPKAMGSLKWAMLNVHLWSCYMDILICSMVTPYLMLPAVGGFTVGVLRFLGVPTSVQTYLAITSVGFMFNSITALFENRSSSFQMNWFRFEKNWKRYSFFVFNGFVTAICLSPLFFVIPDQNVARIWQLNTLPCPYPEYFSSPVFILLIDGESAWYLTSVLFVQWCYIFFSIIFFISCTTYYIFYAETVNFSQKTKRLQRMLFIGNLIQVTIPSLFWAFPTFTVLYLVLANIHNQPLNNIGVAFVSLHGLASMLAILFIHQPYREYIKSLVFKEKVVSLQPSLVGTIVT